MRIINTAFLTDGYKPSHIAMQPEGTTYVCVNLTPRSDNIFKRTHRTPFYDGYLLAAGLVSAVQELLDYWQVGFFNRQFAEVEDELAEGFERTYGPGIIDIEPLLALHGLGHLPIRIHAVPEGTLVPMGVPVMIIESTHPEFVWVANYIEPLISSLTWKYMTNATIAFEYRKIFEYYGFLTGVDPVFPRYQGVDFSFRGMSGPEDAARSSAAALLALRSTDNMAGRHYVHNYYGVVPNDVQHIRATEHAIATSNILYRAAINPDMDLGDAERAFVEHLLTKNPTGRIGLVSDSFGFWRMITEILPSLKDVIQSRGEDASGPGVISVRPDSGDPVRILAGYSPNEVEPLDDGTYRCLSSGEILQSYEVDGAIVTLSHYFGYTINAKGYRTLHPSISMIYGDSITLERAGAILIRLMQKGYASDNVLLGIGSYTYQCNTRDTFGFAIKETFARIGDLDIAVYKDPDTAKGSKTSAKGLIDLCVSSATGDLYAVDGVPYDNGNYRPQNMVMLYNSQGLDETVSWIQARERVDAAIGTWLNKL